MWGTFVQERLLNVARFYLGFVSPSISVSFSISLLLLQYFFRWWVQKCRKQEKRWFPVSVWPSNFQSDLLLGILFQLFQDSPGVMSWKPLVFHFLHLLYFSIFCFLIIVLSHFQCMITKTMNYKMFWRTTSVPKRLGAAVWIKPECKDLQISWNHILLQQKTENTSNV